MDKEIIAEATKAALDAVKTERDGRQKLTEDLLFHIVGASRRSRGGLRGFCRAWRPCRF